MYNIIYKIYWDNCPYFYVGQAVSFKTRKANHVSYLKRNKHKNDKLQNVFNKYGTPKFKILEQCRRSEMDAREQDHLDAHKENPYCCNILKIASSTKGYKHSPETLEKLKQIMSTPEYREKLRQNAIGHSRNVGQKRTAETRSKISKALQGKKVTEENRLLFIERVKEHRRKNPDYKIKHSSETKCKMSHIKLGCNNPNFGKIACNARPIYNVKTCETFTSIKEAAVKYALNYATLKDKLSGRMKNNTDLIYQSENASDQNSAPSLN
jgi:group I intron endonuclease